MDAVVLGVAVIFGLGGCLLGLRHHHTANTTGSGRHWPDTQYSRRFEAGYLGPLTAQTLVIAGPMVMAYGLWRDRQLCKCTNPTHSH